MKESFDKVGVCGRAAGNAAAVRAARAGCATLLMDGRGAAGGTGGFSGLTTLCGLFDDEGQWLNDGFAREFASAVSGASPLRMGNVWVLPYEPEKFRQTAAALLASTEGLQTCYDTAASDAVVEDNRIVSLNGFEAGAVIDCSGTAEVARLAGAECLATDETTQAPAVVFSLSNVRHEMNSAASIAQALLPLVRVTAAVEFSAELRAEHGNSEIHRATSTSASADRGVASAGRGLPRLRRALD